MQYFFTIIIFLVGFIPLNIWANNNDNRKTESSQVPEVLASEGDIKSATNQTENNTQPEDHTSTMFSKFPNSWSDISAFQLENLSIGKAIMEGDIEAYNNALRELIYFNVSLVDILKLKTTDKKTLLELMITPKKNQEYFARELLHLLILITAEHSLNPSPLEFNFKHHLELAKQFNNEIAFQYLTDLYNLLHIAKKEILHKDEIILFLSKKSKHRSTFTLAGGYLVAGGIMAALGYDLLNSSIYITELLSFAKLTDISLMARDTIASNKKMIGAGVIAIGVGLGTTAFIKCKKAFRSSRALKKQKRDLNYSRTNLENL